MQKDIRGESDCFAPVVFFLFFFSKVSPLAKKRFTAVPYITLVKLRDNKYRDGSLIVFLCLDFRCTVSLCGAERSCPMRSCTE